MRKVLYVSGTRADFGLICSTLQKAAADPRLQVGVCVTGMHLQPRYGETFKEIEAAGLPIVARIPVNIDGSDGAAMARALAEELAGLVDVFSTEQPDIVLLLGDRGEMLAGALAALHLNIPLVHLHGGELSGTVDEPIRHAISKLSHYHFTATQGARERLIRMGELPERIFVTGAPGLDGISAGKQIGRDTLIAQNGFAPSRPLALLLFHPVVQEAGMAREQTRQILAALDATGCQVLALMPNADAGGIQVSIALEKWAAGRSGTSLRKHLPRPDYLTWLANTDLLIGNSSSGIIEAASFGIPVINVGSRQEGRERSGNVLDVGHSSAELVTAITASLARGRQPSVNVYGDGHAGERIVEWLATLSLDPELLSKRNAY